MHLYEPLFPSAAAQQFSIWANVSVLAKRPFDRTKHILAVTTNINNPFASSIANGYYVVGVINNDANSVGAVSYYVMTNTEFRAFSAKLLSSTDYLGSISDISEQLTKVLFNPFSYISSCIWIPVQPPTSGNVTTIPVGWWEVAATAKKLSATIRSGGSRSLSAVYFSGRPDTTL